MSTLIEPEYEEAFKAWRAAPGPAANTQMLQTVDPIVQGAIRTHAGSSNPLLVSHARRIALEGLRSYDPSRGRLKTHLYSQLQGLKRAQRQQGQILSVPERVAQDRYRLEQLEEELRNELGREPTDLELADRTGFSGRRMSRLRSYQPAVAEGTLEAASQEIFGAADPAQKRRDLWVQLVYDDLDPYHQKIMEYTLGLNGRVPLSNAAIANRLGRSAGAISQAKLRIQRMLDEGEELSPF